MRKYILMPVLALLAMTELVHAQDFDNKPVINIKNVAEKLNFAVGARFMMDAAYYHSDFTPLKSGASISDACIRASLNYEDWYFYADFGFSNGKYVQKNLLLQYTIEGDKGFHRFKAGYYNNPATMGNNVGRGNLHFISRPSAVNAMAPGRELGVSYSFYNEHFFANQGVFAENKYNDQLNGYQGLTFGGRWLWRPINDDKTTLHVGGAFRYANIATGDATDGNVLKTNLEINTSLETYVDNTKEFVSAQLPWAKHVIDASAELLYKNNDFFARGEYMYKHVTKKRDDQALFEANLGSIDSWGTLESWKAGNPLGSNSFQGAYVEAGYKIFGKAYGYSNSDGVLNGLDGRALEIVARYSYVGLNDIVSGEKYVAGRDQYYPEGILKDYPSTSKSIGGGNMHSATIGVNYAFNRFAQVLLSYTYHRLDRDKYPSDKNFHVLQARLMFQF